MISKTLGQLTQDETRLWEMVFCLSTTSLRSRALCFGLADGAIVALREVRAESEAKPTTGEIGGNAAGADRNGQNQDTRGVHYASLST